MWPPDVMFDTIKVPKCRYFYLSQKSFQLLKKDLHILDPCDQTDASQLDLVTSLTLKIFTCNISIGHVNVFHFTKGLKFLPRLLHTVEVEIFVVWTFS